MRTTLKLLLVALLFCVSAGAQVAVLSGQAINQYGQPLPFASVRVCSVTLSGNPCDITGVQLYSDYALSQPIGDPATTDQYGNYLIYVGSLAPPNLYLVQLTPAPGITWNYAFNGPGLSAGNVTFNGNVTAHLFNATVAPYYEILGSQITSAALADHANIAYLNVANVFVATPQTAPVFNATSQFAVNGVQIASTNLGDSSNIARLNASNVFGSFNLQTVGSLSATNTVNANTGFRVNNAAGTAGQCLSSNGSVYNTPINCITSATLFYQTIQRASIPQTQAAAINFSNRFNVSNGFGATNIDVNGTGTETEVVTSAGAGSPNQCASWDSSGGLQGASVGVCAGPPVQTRTCVGSACYFIQNDGTIVQWGTVSGCTDTDGSDGCTVSVTFPVSFTTTSNLSITESCNWATRNCAAGDTGRSTTGFTMNLAAFVFVGGNGSHLDSTETADWIAIGH